MEGVPPTRLAPASAAANNKKPMLRVMLPVPRRVRRLRIDPAHSHCSALDYILDPGSLGGQCERVCDLFELRFLSVRECGTG